MSTPGGYVRSFIAAQVPEEARQIMAKVMRELADQIPGSVRWVDPQGIHLTFKFLGDIPSIDAVDILEAIKPSVGQVTSFSLQLSGLGMFPNARRPRVLWAGVERQEDSPDSLVKLHEGVDEALAQMNYATERQTFSPHLTLGRVRDNVSPGARRRISQAISSTTIEDGEVWRVDEIHLFRTTFSPQGSIYTSMGSVPLAKG